MSDLYDIEDDGDRVEVRVLRPRWLVRLNAVAVVLSAGYTVVLVLVGGLDALVGLLVPGAILLLALAARLTLRRTYVVDAFGIDRPRRGKRLGWGDVTHVEKTGPWTETVVVGLAGGGTERTMFPPHLAPRMAELGRVPLRG